MDKEYNDDTENEMEMNYFEINHSLVHEFCVVNRIEFVVLYLVC